MTDSLPDSLHAYLRELRQSKGLSLGDLARWLGYRNINKGCNRIALFEQSCGIAPELLERLIVLLDADPEIVEAIRERELAKQEADQDAWLLEPVEPLLTIRLVPGVASVERVPDDLTTLEAALEWASDRARSLRMKAVLQWGTRGNSHWINQEGHLEAVGAIRTPAHSLHTGR